MSFRRKVITGIGCVSPNGVGREAFAAACIEGRSGLKRLEGDEYAGLRTPAVGRVEGFAPESVMGPVDLRRVPRVVPLALAAAREAMTHARLDVSDQEIARRTALVLGTGGGGLSFVEEQYKAWFTQGKGSLFTITAGTHGNLAGELSIALGLRGPSHVVSTGCASSTDALGYAMMLIEAGRADAVIAGGTDAPIAPGILHGFEKMGVICTRPCDDPRQASRPFSASRSGFILGEGSWIFVIESGESAEARGATVICELAGYGSTCDAYHRVQIAPDVEECVRAMQLALNEAGASPDEIDSANLHGTGTEMNDRLETLAMHKLLGGRARHVPMSATKSMIGHPQGAGGAAGVAAAILCARQGLIHPTINLEDPDPACDLDYVPGTTRRREQHVILSNCIAFGSKNSALVLRMRPKAHPGRPPSVRAAGAGSVRNAAHISAARIANGLWITPASTSAHRPPSQQWLRAPASGRGPSAPPPLAAEAPPPDLLHRSSRRSARRKCDSRCR